jgi:hypothetical protein
MVEAVVVLVVLVEQLQLLCRELAELVLLQIFQVHLVIMQVVAVGRPILLEHLAELEVRTVAVQEPIPQLLEHPVWPILVVGVEVLADLVVLRRDFLVETAALV